MDSVSALLDGPRAERAFLLKAVFDGSWSVSIEDEAPLSVVIVAQGTATIRTSHETHRLIAGDVAIARGPEHYVVADSPSTPDDIRILPGQVCVDAHGHLLEGLMDLGIRTWGNTRSSDATTLLIGTYERRSSVGGLLLSRLPALVVLRDLQSPLVPLLAGELTYEAPGQSVVLDRLLDLLVVTCLRETLPPAGEGPTDPAVEEALRAMHLAPAHPWTVQALAGRVGLSRAALARRFTSRVGEPPLTHLTRLRLAMAADLIGSTDLTLAAIAPRVGYASAFALSAAFKRQYGASPAAHRRDAAASASGSDHAGATQVSRRRA